MNKRIGKSQTHLQPNQGFAALSTPINTPNIYNSPLTNYQHFTDTVYNVPNEKIMTYYTTDINIKEFHLICDFRPSKFLKINDFKLVTSKTVNRSSTVQLNTSNFVATVSNQQPSYLLKLEYTDGIKNIFIETKSDDLLKLWFSITGSPHDEDIKNDDLFSFRDEFVKRIAKTDLDNGICKDCIFRNEYMITGKCKEIYTKSILLDNVDRTDND